MTRLEIKVIPKSSQSKVVRQEGDFYKVYVHAAPDRGKANAAVIALLAAHFGVAKQQIKILRGADVRNKLIEIDTEAA